MAASTAPTLLITPKPHSLSRKPNPRSTSTCSRRNPHSTIASSSSSSSSSSFRNGSPPETSCPVPWEQQPVNEYQALSTSFPFSWAASDLRDYCTRLALTGSSFAILVGLPIAAFSNTSSDTLRCGVTAFSAGILAVILAALRMYLGWAYVGNRLLSATVEYEETGWYDGQIWVKTPEVLARDRLLGSFSVKPVLTRVKFTLVGLAISLAVCVIIVIDVENPKKIPDNTGGKVIAGVYNDEAARSFEPDAFCGEPDLS